MSRRVPAVVSALAGGLRALLGEGVVAMYLGGSFSMGDFIEGASDYDLLVVVADPLSPAELRDISALHDDLLRAYADAAHLEGDYAPRMWLVPEGTTQAVPFFRAGRLLERSDFMLSADNIANMRRDGIVVFGPGPMELLPEVTPDHVRTAVRAMLRDEPDCATEREAADEILELVRSLAAIETGAPTTKSGGARWALERIDARWHPFILRAEKMRRGAPPNENEQTLRRALAEMRAALVLA